MLREFQFATVPQIGGVPVARKVCFPILVLMPATAARR
jgi:hypothetical protein